LACPRKLNKVIRDILIRKGGLLVDKYMEEGITFTSSQKIQEKRRAVRGPGKYLPGKLFGNFRLPEGKGKRIGKNGVCYQVFRVLHFVPVPGKLPRLERGQNIGILNRKRFFRDAAFGTSAPYEKQG
jgi:hypothetical protein